MWTMLALEVVSVASRTQPSPALLVGLAAVVFSLLYWLKNQPR